MAHSFSLRFYLNENKTKGNEFMIYGRLIIDRKKSEFATNYYIEENKWDDAKGRAKKNSIINDELTELEAEIMPIKPLNINKVSLS
jgi:hypothetical protein